jgi:hypothetical protein
MHLEADWTMCSNYGSYCTPIVNTIGLTYVTTYSPLAQRSGMSRNHLKLESHLFVQFIGGWPTTLDNWSWSPTRSLNAWNVQHLSNITRQKTKLPSSSQILACEWWQLNSYLIVLCESRLSTQTLDVSAHPTSQKTFCTRTRKATI